MNVQNTQIACGSNVERSPAEVVGLPPYDGGGALYVPDGSLSPEGNAGAGERGRETPKGQKRRDGRTERPGKRTGEEIDDLVSKARNHEEWAVLELWEAVRRFVSWRANRYLRRGNNAERMEYDDLMQAGFLAMLDAVEKYNTERDYSFLTLLDWKLRRRFAEVGGHRSTRRDMLRYADSLDVPAYQDQPDGESAGDVIPDPCGEYAFMLVDYEEFRGYCRKLLIAAMERLTPSQREDIKAHYFHFVPLEKIGGAERNRQNVGANIKRGLLHMRVGKYHKELREALQGFEDFREMEGERLRRVELRGIAK